MSSYEERVSKKRSTVEKNLKYLGAGFPEEFKVDMVRLMEYMYEDGFNDGQEWSLNAILQAQRDVREGEDIE
ncbi:hypothetical protein EHV15_05035 [Paenibacillus oralis]|uniref:Uncharacterized protein n=1 Tax=Paenibacillus oralis TaxID=2490856 RepID=A0A3P3TX69_9BACL|nr:hypothetical protein [Paenibacillus oralis]RRJ62384.1 hypothetical protein EHV15_05035 [Paenibacillus oralis]